MNVFGRPFGHGDERGSILAVILRVSLFLLGILYIFIGFGFLTDPIKSGADFGLALLDETSAQGLASIRGDFTSFFWVIAGSLIIGVWRSNATLLHVGASLVGIVFVIRAGSAVVDGTYAGWITPMAVELLTLVLAVAAARILPSAD